MQKPTNRDEPTSAEMEKAPPIEPLGWEMGEAGEYRSTDGTLTVQRINGGWHVYHHNELWGEWDRNWPFGKEYVPFKTLQDAKDLLDEYRFRGFV